MPRRQDNAGQEKLHVVLNVERGARLYCRDQMCWPVPRKKHNCRLCSRWKAPAKTLQPFLGPSLSRDKPTDPHLDDSCAQLIG